jgi:hypothetical protein
VRKVTQRLATAAMCVACLVSVVSAAGAAPQATLARAESQFNAPDSSAAFKNAGPVLLDALGGEVPQVQVASPSVVASAPPMTRTRALLIAGLLVVGSMALMIAALPFSLGRRRRPRGPNGVLTTLSRVAPEARAIVVATGALAFILWAGY